MIVVSCDSAFCHSSAEATAAMLELQVEQLSRDVHRQQGVTISMAHNKG